MADFDLDFLARQMECLLTGMQGMREEMGSIYAELNSMRAEMANMRDDMRSMRDEIRALSTTVAQADRPRPLASSALNGQGSAWEATGWGDASAGGP